MHLNLWIFKISNRMVSLDPSLEKSVLRPLCRWPFSFSVDFFVGHLSLHILEPTVSENVSLLNNGADYRNASFNYIVGSFLDTMESMTPHPDQVPQQVDQITPVDYNENMLMVDYTGMPQAGVKRENPFEEYEAPVVRRRSMNDTLPQIIQQREGMRHRHSDPPAYSGQYYDQVMMNLNTDPMMPNLMQAGYAGSAIQGLGATTPLPRTQMLSMHPYGTVSDGSDAMYSSSPMMNAGSFECNFPKCRGRSFMTLNALQTHMASHSVKSSKGKAFSCTMCPQTFSRSHDLKRHYYVHTDDKPYKCNRCQKGFSRRDALRRHERSVLEGKKVHCMSLGGAHDEEY